MLRRLPRILVECLVALVLVCTGLLLWASYYIDTGEFRARFTETMETVLGRSVTLKGDLDIAIWPRLALTVEDLGIGEAPGFGDGPAAHFNDIEISVRILPLLSHHVEVEFLELKGLKGVVVRNGQGVFNWQSLVERGGQGGEGATMDGWTFAVNSVEITDAELLFRDEMAATEYKLSGIDIHTGNVTLGEDVPFSLSSGFSWADQGIKADLVLKGMIRVMDDGTPPVFSRTTVQAKVYGDFLPKKAAPGEFIAAVDLDWDKRIVTFEDIRASLFGLRAEGDVTSGDLDKGLDFRGHITVHPFVPRDLIALYAPDMPVKDVDGLRSSAVASFVHVTEEGARFDNLILTLDDITVRGRCAFTGWTRPVLDFDLRGNTLDLDRYLPLFRTGTPFIWDDFGLPFFRALRGGGTARADGFKVLDTLISDIRLKVAATDKGIAFDAGAIREGMASLGGTMDVAIGTDKAGDPTLALSAVVDAESQRRGFAFLHRDPLDVGGSGTLHLEVSVPKMACPPDARSIYILQHLDGLARLSLGGGKAVLKRDKAEPLSLDYTRADLEVKVRPDGNGAKGVWNSTVSAGIKLRTGGDLESLNGTADGVLSAGIDELRAQSRGMAVSGYLTSPRLPKDARRLTFGGTVAFDTAKGAASLTDGVFQVLETTLKGDARLAGSAGKRRVEGAFDVAQADPKRIIYLLTGENLRTRDGDALRKAALAARYEADGNGFTLSDLSGELDGTTVKGHVVGTGYPNPLLAFSLASGPLNLDRYLTPAPAPSLSDVRAGRVPESTPAKMPLEFLRALKLNGKVLFQEFTLARVRCESLEGFVRANEGIIHLSRMQGKLHGGTLKAGLEGQAGLDALDLHLTLDVDKMQAGPFMLEMAEREYLRGETDIKADLHSVGRTDDDILANLDGTASVRITNGSFKFTGWDLPVRPVDEGRGAQIGAEQQRRTNGRTVFRRSSSDATVEKGVFRIDNFRLEAPPVLQAYGEGNFSLPANTIDLSIRNDFVAVPSVTLHLTGKLTDPKVEVPTGRIVNDTVLNILSLPKKSFEFLRDLF
ncbi:AsmA family protein [Pseudodesulfovibrio mercurii]|uniref:AsmA family protein n=1 Tax=Pseudodesulfovibrio mercurii TaxID=641491 RepID=F0JG88_9BACT|nr:AsmA family protein [Pseudodesulfovibrio mercurii]EGB13836.1 AsmA family protein [Pseudodesulfovibrio mercurii]